MMASIQKEESASSSSPLRPNAMEMSETVQQEVAVNDHESLSKSVHDDSNNGAQGEPLFRKLCRTHANNINDQQEEDEEGCWVEALSGDVYSLLYTAPFNSQAFVYAVLSVWFQWTIIGLALSDLVDPDSPQNPLMIPPGVNIEVTTAQALALILAAAMQDDLITGSVNFLQDAQVDRDVMPGATKCKHLLSTMSQMLAGASMLVVIFILVMQSSAVMGMFLNFAALSFVSEIDSIFFHLALRGFCTRPIQRECQKVMEIKVPATTKFDKYKRLLFVIVCIGLISGYGIIKHDQQQGRYLCDSILMQLGDAFSPSASYFSGVYDRTSQLVNGRATYLDRHSDMAMIAYCDVEKAWTLTFWFDNSNGDDDHDNSRHSEQLRQDSSGSSSSSINPCLWVAKSPMTDTYDVTTVTDDWVVVQTESRQPLPLDSFYLECNDCQPSQQPQEEEQQTGTMTTTSSTLCSSTHGTCFDNVCLCNDGRYGLNCEFPRPCPTLVVDERHGGFPVVKAGTAIVSNEYTLLRNGDDSDDGSDVVQVYYRPVYVAEKLVTEGDSHDDGQAVFDVILFTGRHWMITDTFQMGLANNTKDGSDPSLSSKQELVDYLTYDFHAFYSNPYVPYFISEASDVGSPTNVLTPVGLQWFQSREERVFHDAKNGDDNPLPLQYTYHHHELDPNQPVDTKLLCAVCDNTTNVCYNYNDCNTTTTTGSSAVGKCECRMGYTGSLCEKELPCKRQDDASSSSSSFAACLNGGNCTDDYEFCICPDGFYGNVCEFQV